MKIIIVVTVILIILIVFISNKQFFKELDTLDNKDLAIKIKKRINNDFFTMLMFILMILLYQLI